MRKRTETVIEVSEWDALVTKTYGRPYDYQQQEGGRERGEIRFKVPDVAAEKYTHKSISEMADPRVRGVVFAQWLARDLNQQFQDKNRNEYALLRWWDEVFYPDLQTLANDMHTKGVLETGDYCIDVDW